MTKKNQITDQAASISDDTIIDSKMVYSADFSPFENRDIPDWESVVLLAPKPIFSDNLSDI